MFRQQQYKQLAVYAISNIQGQCVFSLFAKSTMYAVTYEFGSCWLIKVCFWFSKVQWFLTLVAKTIIILLPYFISLLPQASLIGQGTNARATVDAVVVGSSLSVRVNFDTPFGYA